MWSDELIKKSEYIYEISKDYSSDMNVPGRIFTDANMLEQIKKDNAIQQVVNVATLPGIVKASLAMPDIHWGYGFSIGGVAAFDYEKGIISPGGVGYDINCGVRLVKTDLYLNDIKDKIELLIDNIFNNVPCGVGSKNREKRSKNELDEVLRFGVEAVTDDEYYQKDDKNCIEEYGKMKDSDESKVSEKAKNRGGNQLGTLGAGNHFIEIQKVEKIFDPIAKKLGIEKEGQIMVMIHSGSRGLGHQVATDYIQILNNSLSKFDIILKDRQLVCAPINSKEGENYYGAMCAAANYGFTNRQMILHKVRKSFEDVLKIDVKDLKLIYDVAHNIAKIENHIVDGENRKLCIHRKGATRSFAAGREELPSIYQDTGQPVIIPGDMGTASYVLLGTDYAMKETFGSTCHGAGRVMSRSAALRKFTNNGVKRELADKGIYVKAASGRGIVEEAPAVYKNVNDVVRIVEGAGLSKIIAKMVPLGVIKG